MWFKLILLQIWCLPQIWNWKNTVKNLSKFHRKKPLSESFLYKVAGPSTCNFIKNQTRRQVFSCEYWEIFKNTFFYRISESRSETSNMAPASSKEFLHIQANYRVWIHSDTCTWHDNNIQSTIKFDVFVLFLIFFVSMSQKSVINRSGACYFLHTSN